MLSGYRLCPVHYTLSLAIRFLFPLPPFQNPPPVVTRRNRAAPRRDRISGPTRKPWDLGWFVSSPLAKSLVSHIWTLGNNLWRRQLTERKRAQDFRVGQLSGLRHGLACQLPALWPCVRHWTCQNLSWWSEAYLMWLLWVSNKITVGFTLVYGKCPVNVLFTIDYSLG